MAKRTENAAKPIDILDLKINVNIYLRDRMKLK